MTYYMLTHTYKWHVHEPTVLHAGCVSCDWQATCIGCTFTSCWTTSALAEVLVHPQLTIEGELSHYNQLYFQKNILEARNDHDTFVNKVRHASIHQREWENATFLWCWPQLWCASSLVSYARDITQNTSHTLLYSGSLFWATLTISQFPYCRITI